MADDQQDVMGDVAPQGEFAGPAPGSPDGRHPQGGEDAGPSSPATTRYGKLFSTKAQLVMQRSTIATALRTPPALMANDSSAPSALTGAGSGFPAAMMAGSMMPGSMAPRPPSPGPQLPPPPPMPQMPSIDASSTAPMPSPLFNMLMRIEAAQVRIEAKVDLLLDTQVQPLGLQMDDTTNPAK